MNSEARIYDDRQGRTSCCDCEATCHDTTLVCKGCWETVEHGTLPPRAKPEAPTVEQKKEATKRVKVILRAMRANPHKGRQGRSFIETLADGSRLWVMRTGSYVRATRYDNTGWRMAFYNIASNAPTLVTCTTCNGRGAQKITVEEDGKPNETVTITCIDCKGRRRITPVLARFLDEQRNMWCECDEPSDPMYYADGEHPRVHKHHWRCSSCRKVVQLG